MDAQAIIRLIQTADKKTPVKVYLNVTEPIKFEKCKVFGQGIAKLFSVITKKSHQSSQKNPLKSLRSK